MKVCILMGSPHPAGNTASLSRLFVEALSQNGCAVSALALYNLDLRPCIGCRSCQEVHSGFGCPQPDDMKLVFDAVLACDLLVLAGPVYSWYCTPPTKAVLDRLVYGMNKYYGEAKGPALWAGKGLALLSTCGYRPERGSDLWEEGMRRYAKHSALRWMGCMAERHLGYGTEFMDEDKAGRARDFAARLVSEL